MIRNGLPTKNAINSNLKVVGIQCSFKNFPYNYTRKNLYKKENIVPKVEKGLLVQAVARINIRLHVYHMNTIFCLQPLPQ